MVNRRKGNQQGQSLQFSPMNFQNILFRFLLHYSSSLGFLGGGGGGYMDVCRGCTPTQCHIACIVFPMKKAPWSVTTCLGNPTLDKIRVISTVMSQRKTASGYHVAQSTTTRMYLCLEEEGVSSPTMRMPVQSNGTMTISIDCKGPPPFPRPWCN